MKLIPISQFGKLKPMVCCRLRTKQVISSTIQPDLHNVSLLIAAIDAAKLFLELKVARQHSGVFHLAA